MPIELPVTTPSPPASELELIALASLLPWCLSLLLACHSSAIAQAFLLMGRFG